MMFKEVGREDFTEEVGIELVWRNGRGYGLSCVPPNHMLKSQFPVLQNVTAFGDRVFKEEINGRP